MSSKNVLRLLQSAREINAKTADYSVQASDFDSILTTRGAAGTVIFTLPTAANSKGGIVEFYSVADQTMTVAGQDEEIVAINDLTADSVSFQTSSEKIGGGFRAVCDGTSWIVVPLATETQTVTVASS